MGSDCISFCHCLSFYFEPTLDCNLPVKIVTSKPVATSSDATLTRMNELVLRPPLRNFHLTDIHRTINAFSSYYKRI